MKTLYTACALGCVLSAVSFFLAVLGGALALHWRLVRLPKIGRRVGRVENG